MCAFGCQKRVSLVSRKIVLLSANRGNFSRFSCLSRVANHTLREEKAPDGAQAPCIKVYKSHHKHITFYEEFMSVMRGGLGVVISHATKTRRSNGNDSMRI